MEALDPIFPIKGYSGSIISSTDSIVRERVAAFQVYLEGLLERRDILEDEAIKEFFDFEGKGNIKYFD